MNSENFEQSLSKLQEMTEKIKSSKVTLQESISYYEEGMKYYTKCNEILLNAKQKIEFFEREE